MKMDPRIPSAKERMIPLVLETHTLANVGVLRRRVSASAHGCWRNTRAPHALTHYEG